MLFESIINDLKRYLPKNRLLVEKNKMRELLMQRRRLLTKEQIAEQSALLLTHLESLPAFESARTILIYYPAHNEVDVLPLIKKYKREKQFLFPVVHRRYMDACPYEGNAKMHRGKFNIPEPTTQAYKGDIDMILVPGVAFDAHGNRLGRGGGYYDKYLAKKRRNTTLIGVAYDFQVVDKVPAGVLDKKMNYIITPTRGVISACGTSV